MHGLHRRNDAELGKPWNVGVIEDLHVLDSKPVIDGRNRFERGFVGVERDAIAAVADRVRADLESTLKRARRDVAQMLGRGLEQAAVFWIVGVWVEQRRAA
jgi:hypothetical protein